MIRCSWATVSSTYYGSGTILVYGTSPNDIMYFFKVSEIFLFNYSILIFKGDLLHTVDFDEHFQAYEIEELSNQKPVFKLHNDLESSIPCNINVVAFNKYVTLRNPI